jgi:hypothetical protein
MAVMAKPDPTKDPEFLRTLQDDRNHAVRTVAWAISSRLERLK